MSSVKLLQLKDNLTITEADAYFNDKLEQKNSDSLIGIITAINEGRLKLYLNPEWLNEYELSCIKIDSIIEDCEYKLIGEHEFLKPNLFKKRNTLYLNAGEQMQGDIFIGNRVRTAIRVGPFGSEVVFTDIAKLEQQDRDNYELSRIKELQNKVYKSRVSTITEAFKVSANKGSALYIKRKEIDALLESLPTKSARETNQAEDQYAEHDRHDFKEGFDVKRFHAMIAKGYGAAYLSKYYLTPYEGLINRLKWENDVCEQELALQGKIIKPDLGKYDKQEMVILEKIQKLGYHPKQLPPYEDGKKGVRSELREALKEHDLFQNKTGFRKAWERLLNDSAIKYL